MASWNSPAVARRWLAYELRRLREERDLAQKDVGKACGWSGVRVSYLEKWDHPQRIFDRDLDKLLPLYEVPEGDRRPYYDAAKASREKGWWERYGPDVVPAFLSTFIGLEQGASHIRTLEPTIVPGLLQTSDYMAAAIAGGMTQRTPRLVGEVAAVRIERQKVLTRAQGPAHMVAVVDESVIRRVVGGPAVMAAQLHHIADMSRRQNVELYVYPFERGVGPGLIIASHRILHFAHGVPPVVYMEAVDHAQWIDDGAAVDLHDLAFNGVVGSSLSADDSHAMVLDVAKSFEKRT